MLKPSIAYLCAVRLIKLLSEMTQHEAENILQQLKSSSHFSLADSLVRSAIRYARLRVDWYLLSAPERINTDKERTIAHNAFISACDILSRNMIKSNEDASWRKRIGDDRKDIGDFACWIHLIYGLKAR
jgi:hypothetical protein